MIWEDKCKECKYRLKCKQTESDCLELNKNIIERKKKKSNTMLK